MKENDLLEITKEEAVVIFSAQGEFISRLNRFVDSVEFYTLPPLVQECMLEGQVRHELTYKKVAEYLSDIGCGQDPLRIFDKDTKSNLKPKGGI